jgi:AraC-like DNA-binding protein
MLLWSTKIITHRPMRHFPRAMHVAAERIGHIDGYHHEGRHRHLETWALFKYTLAGEGIFRDGRGEHRVGPGEGFLCYIPDPQTAYYYPPERREPWEFMFMTVTGNDVEQKVQSVVDRHGRPIFRFDPRSPLIEMFRSFQCRGRQQLTLSPHRSGRLADEFWSALLAACPGADAPAYQVLSLSARARSLIETHRHRPINVTELADMLGVSREYLSRRFYEETMMQPGAYIRRQRILLACELLKETTLSIKQVGIRLGFDSPQHFSRTFKAVMTITPSRFRDVGVTPVL